MPHLRSAKKRLRQNKKRRLHNREIKKAIRIQIKRFLRALNADDHDGARQELRLCAKRLDKAGQRRVIHPNKAARKKSQLARLLNKKVSQT